MKCRKQIRARHRMELNNLEQSIPSSAQDLPSLIEKILDEINKLEIITNDIYLLKDLLSALKATKREQIDKFRREIFLMHFFFFYLLESIDQSADIENVQRIG
ncbi:unnamed protein product [Rotaria socialis]|uniref:Uncharacterized protein n=1 Tax=Rotaria socialis TaxID=392032 RepID=A0A818PCL8_9BILA|nr:unnamed protein product [Rotaria socialis]